MGGIGTPVGGNLDVSIENEAGEIGVQNPLCTNGDSVYEKDIWVDESDSTGWDGEIIGLFNNLHTSFDFIGTDNPKELLIHFNRTVVSNAIGLGCTGGGDFSNTKIEIINSGSVATTVVDESGSSTKYTSRTFQLPITAGFNAVRFTFGTADDVCLTNCVILKSISVVARLQAVKTDNTVTDINATNGSNLKVSLEEVESQISDDDNKRLMTSPYLIDEFGNVGRMLSDNLFLGAPVVIDSAHHEIHCGDSYEATHNTTLANGASVNFLIIVPDEPGSGQSQKLYHLLGQVASERESSVQLFEDTDSTGGTAIASHNRNRNSALNDVLAITYDTTVTTDGLSIFGPWRIGSGRSSAGDVNRQNEFVLKNNTRYLLRVTNQTVNNNNVNVEFNYYVHPGI